MTLPPAPAPVRQKKSFFKRPIFWILVIVVIVIIAIIAGNSGGSGNNSANAPSTGAPQSSAAPSSGVGATTSPAAPKASDDPFSDGGWKISDIQVQPGQFGTSVTGRVTNQTNATKTGVFTLTIFSNGQRIADVQGSANNVEAGQTSTVTFIGTTQNLPGDPSTYTYEFQSDF